MADTFPEMKNQVEELISTLESLSHEAKTFGEVTLSLESLSDRLADISVSLAGVISQSEIVYQYATEVSVTNTLDSFSAAAQGFSVSAERLIEEVRKSESKNSSELQETAQDICKSNIELGDRVESNKKSMTEMLQELAKEASEEIKKRIMIMGGISIACSVLAVVLAVVL